MENTAPNYFSKNKSVLLISILLMLFLAGVIGFVWDQTWDKQSVSTKSENTSISERKRFEPIISPLGNKEINFVDGNIIYFDGGHESTWGKYEDSEVDSIKAIWSPDETYVSITRQVGDFVHNEIFNNGTLVFESLGQFSIYWANDTTAYVVYQHRVPMYTISKLSFISDYYIEETNLIEDYESFGIAPSIYPYTPITASPDGSYVVLARSFSGYYEGKPSILSVVNTKTKKDIDYVTTMQDNLYIIDPALV